MRCSDNFKNENDSDLDNMLFKESENNNRTLIQDNEMICCSELIISQWYTKLLSILIHDNRTITTQNDIDNSFCFFMLSYYTDEQAVLLINIIILLVQ